MVNPLGNRFLLIEIDYKLMGITFFFDLFFVNRKKKNDYHKVVINFSKGKSISLRLNLKNFLGILVTEIWIQEFGYGNLVTKICLQEFD